MKTRSALLPLTLAVITSVFVSASTHAQSPAAPVTMNDVPEETQAARGKERYNPPVPARASLPTLWLIGDSTVRNGSGGWSSLDGQWGWGAPVTAYFDLSKINVVNRALGGTSSRSFYKNQWPTFKSDIRKGDFVMMQFGANDNGDKGALKGVGEDTTTSGEETVHSFGWYLRQYVEETRKAGATPIICSLTPRQGWSEDGKFASGGGHATWAEQAAKETNTPFVPLNALIGRKYTELGKDKVATFYKDKIHTGWDGAAANAECVVAGLKALPSNPLEKFFSKRAQAVAPGKL